MKTTMLYESLALCWFCSQKNREKHNTTRAAQKSYVVIRDKATGQELGRDKYEVGVMVEWDDGRPEPEKEGA